MKITVTEQDLDQAIEECEGNVKPNFVAEHCVITVAARKSFPVLFSDHTGIVTADGELEFVDKRLAAQVVFAFDFKNYERLRTLLPLELEVV